MNIYTSLSRRIINSSITQKVINVSTNNPLGQGNYYTKADSDARFVNVSGDTMTGPLTLSGAPTLDLHASTKKYVDDSIAGFSTDFIGLTDTPSSYTGQGGKAPLVNSGETALEFIDIATQSELNSHTGDATIHFTEGSIDHANIQNIGTNTHGQIDIDLARLANTSGTNTGDQDLSPYQLLSEKGVANGYASLDGAGLVPSSQLPSYVDDVLEYADLASFPATGETGKIYVAIDTNNTYRWSGTAYVELTDSTAIWGDISGTLSNQTDLQNALNLKANLADLATVATSGDHTDLSNIGTNTHAQIDTHIASTSNPHNTTALNTPYTPILPMPSGTDTVAEGLEFLNSVRSRYIGLVTQPTITDDGVDTITVGACIAFLCNCEDFDENTRGNNMNLAETSLTITDNNQVYYVIAKRVGETATYELITDKLLLAKPNKALVAVVIRTGTTFHIFQANGLGSGLPEKAQQLSIEKDGFGIVSGLGVSADDTTRVVTVNSGSAFYGASIKEVFECVSDVDNIRFYTWNGTGYDFSITTLANNTQYNDTTALANLTGNKFNVNWIWRGVETQKHIYSVLSREQYNSVAEAVASEVPLPPDIVLAHAVFVGGIVYQNGVDEAQAYIVPKQETGTQLANIHNNLGGLQGGAVDEYYHLTSAQTSLLDTALQPADLSTWTGSTNLTTLGTITSGTWNGTAITNDYLAGIVGSKVSLDTTNFDNNLDGTVTNVQLLADAVDELTTGGGSGYWDRDAVNGYVYPTTLTDNVGIQNNNPQTALQVGADWNAVLDDSYYTIKVGPSPQNVGNIALNGNTTILDFHVNGIRKGYIQTRNDLQNFLHTTLNVLTSPTTRITGNVIVGGLTPSARTHIVGAGNTSATSDNILKLDNSDGNVLLVRGDGYVDLPNTTFTTGNLGIISKAGVPFIHNFNYGNNGTVTTVGFNTFIGENAGNSTMGSTATLAYYASYNTAQGAYTLYSNTTGYNNSAQGAYALYSNTTGYDSTAQGVNALRFNTTGNYNSAQGANALRFNTTGYNNNAQGAYTLYSNTTGYNNSAQGANALRYNTTGFNNSAQGAYALYSNTTGFNNSAQGRNALYANTTGNYNSAQGADAGRIISDGTALTITNQSVFLGANTKALADNSTNEIVIGYNTIGLGSNTAVLGNSSITKTALKGNVGIGTETPTARTHIVGAGNTSATFAQKIENSSGTSLLSVRDDGLISFSNYTFPTADGTANQVLTTDGAGNLSFASIDSSVTTGASGTFTSNDGKTITVTNGLITGIV